MLIRGYGTEIDGIVNGASLNNIFLPVSHIDDGCYIILQERLTQVLQDY